MGSSDVRYGLALLAIGVVWLLDGIVASDTTRLSYVPLAALVVLATLFEHGISLLVRTLGGAAILMVLLFGVLDVSVEGDTTRVFLDWTVALALLLSVIVVGRRVASARVVDRSIVLGGILAYVLIGFAMGAAYEAMDLMTDGAMLDGLVGSPDAGAYTYFSFITMTTVGFGDITPATEIGQRVVVLHAIVGQVVLVVFVARLVSLWGVEAEESDDEGTAPDGG